MVFAAILAQAPSLAVQPLTLLPAHPLLDSYRSTLYAMSLTTELSDMITSVGLPAELGPWLVTQKVYNPRTLALSASTEAQVADSITKPAIAGSVPLSTMGDKANVVALWILARKMLPSSSGGTSLGGMSEEGCS